MEPNVATSNLRDFEIYHMFGVLANLIIFHEKLCIVQSLWLFFQGNFLHAAGVESNAKHTESSGSGISSGSNQSMY